MPYDTLAFLRCARLPLGRLASSSRNLKYSSRVKAVCSPDGGIPIIFLLSFVFRLPVSRQRTHILDSSVIILEQFTDTPILDNHPSGSRQPSAHRNDPALYLKISSHTDTLTVEGRDSPHPHTIKPPPFNILSPHQR